MRTSIVTISFNQAKFLDATIYSVLQQDADIEYIVVDPGSTDGSRDIIEKYRNRISKVVLEPDNGPADGLNKGFSLATGKIFGFLNSDDTLLPGAISKISKFFASNPAVDVISGHGHVIDAEGRILRRAFSDRFSLRNYAYGATAIVQPSTFFRASTFASTKGFMEKNRANWDGELFVDMALAGAKFGLINEYLSCYRLHPMSITSSKRLQTEHQLHSTICFEKIMGRQKTRLDPLITQAYRLKKHISHPRATWERILHGPIFGRRA